MKKIDEQIKQLHEIQYLILKMEEEIELLRNINYRYYLMHGNNIKEGVVNVPNNISFSLSGDITDTKCQIIQHDKLGITSNYLIIKETINKIKST